MNSPTYTNQASEDKPINQHLVCLWQLRDIEETIADASPEELVDLHSKLVALSTDITEAVQSLIRTEKLKLLAEVRERVIGEDERIDIQSDYDKLDVPHLETDKYPGLDGVRQASRNLCRERQRTALTKLEAEL